MLLLLKCGEKEKGQRQKAEGGRTDGSILLIFHDLSHSLLSCIQGREADRRRRDKEGEDGGRQGGRPTSESMPQDSATLYVSCCLSNGLVLTHSTFPQTDCNTAHIVGLHSVSLGPWGMEEEESTIRGIPISLLAGATVAGLES